MKDTRSKRQKRIARKYTLRHGGVGRKIGGKRYSLDSTHRKKAAAKKAAKYNRAEARPKRFARVVRWSVKKGSRHKWAVLTRLK